MSKKSFHDISFTTPDKLEAIDWANSFLDYFDPVDKRTKRKSAIFLAGCYKDLMRQVETLKSLGYSIGNQKIVEWNKKTHKYLEDEISKWEYGPKLYRGSLFEICSEIGFEKISYINYDGMDNFSMESFLELGHMMDCGVDAIHRTYTCRYHGQSKEDFLQYCLDNNVELIRKVSYTSVSERRRTGLKSEQHMRDNQLPKAYDLAKIILSDETWFPSVKNYEVHSRIYPGKGKTPMLMIVLKKKRPESSSQASLKGGLK